MYVLRVRVYKNIFLSFRPGYHRSVFHSNGKSHLFSDLQTFNSFYPVNWY